MERRHQPRPGLREPRPGQLTAGQTCLRKVQRSQHRPSLITPPRFKVPAHSDPVKHWNFRKADWKRFCLLTGESVKRLPPPDTLNIERVYQDFCESLLSAAKQCIPCSRRKNYVPCRDKECETLYRSFIRAQVGTASGRATSSLSTKTEEAGVTGGSYQLHRLLALQLQGMENHQQTCWQVWTLLPSDCVLSRQIQSPCSW